MIRRRLPLAAGLAAALACLLGVAMGCSVSSTEPFIRQTIRFTFENDLDWTADGTDLDDPPVTWSVERSQELALQGEWAVKLQLANLNDAGKIWMERSFQLDPGASYDVEVAFDFATADFGDINLWTIIAGVSPDDPESVADLTFQDDTGNGAASDAGHRWIAKRYAFTATAEPDGALHAFLGVWGTSEFTRTYYIDNVELTFTRK